MKPIYKSKTFIVAVLTGIAGVLTILSGNGEGWALIALGVVNTVLRLVTSEKVSLV